MAKGYFSSATQHGMNWKDLSFTDGGTAQVMNDNPPAGSGVTTPKRHVL
jgi:hypothetical protein